MRDDPFIGITSWDSELFLGACLQSAINNTAGIRVKVVVLDNCSCDQSAQIVKKYGAELVQRRTNQAEALNALLDMSTAKHTLLIHADVILLSDQWYSLCASKISSSTVFVSPHDIGCGPMTRTFGHGHPESSFMFFDTDAIKAMRRWKLLKRRFLFPTGFGKRFDFYAPHITHRIAEMLKSKNKSWHKMQVHASISQAESLYRPSWPASQAAPSEWQASLAYLQYGLGNFYSLDNVVTHYHNWYDRIGARNRNSDNTTTEPNNQGYPLDFIHAYSRRFIDDFENARVCLPENLDADS